MPMADAVPLVLLPMQMGKGRGRGRGNGRGRAEGCKTSTNAVPPNKVAKHQAATHGGSRTGAGRKRGNNTSTQNIKYPDLPPLETKVKWADEYKRLCGVVASTGKPEEIPEGPGLLFACFDTWEAFMERALKVCADDCKTCMRCWMGAGVVTHDA